MIRVQILSVSQGILCALLGLASIASRADEVLAYSSTPTTAVPMPSLNKPSNHLLDRIPRWVDAMPTIFPPQSAQNIVPSTDDTENLTWVDQKQQQIRSWADETSHKIDNWFGEPDPNKPSSATLRVIVDNRWNKYDEYEIRPRIRGKIKLPALERQFSLLFGDDSLDNELANNIAITNENPDVTSDKTLDYKNSRDENSSFALRWSSIYERLPFESEVDLGMRSGNDVYIRLKAAKNWPLRNDFYFYAEQIYRYGSDSENYLRTNTELTHAHPDKPLLSNQFALTYADAQQDDLTWDNRTFRQHQFFAGNRFNYGLYTGGFYNDGDLRLNSWGPFMSWRQPLWREWFFVQGDLNYFNDHREDRDHYVSALLRLEALF